MELTDELFRHFRIFLKTNNLYVDFMESFRNQTYKCDTRTINKTTNNFIKEMRKYVEDGTNYSEYGAIVFLFGSFNWANYGGGKIPFEFTRQWATTVIKWALYCLRHSIEVCSVERLRDLTRYYNRNKWIDIDMLTDTEKFDINDKLGIHSISDVNGFLKELRYGDLH